MIFTVESRIVLLLNMFNFVHAFIWSEWLIVSTVYNVWLMVALGDVRMMANDLVSASAASELDHAPSSHSAPLILELNHFNDH